MLFAFTAATSPEGRDLARGEVHDHSLVKDWNGSDDEFSIAGKAAWSMTLPPGDWRSRGAHTSHGGSHVLFEFFVEECLNSHYLDGKPQLARWKALGCRTLLAKSL